VLVRAAIPEDLPHIRAIEQQASTAAHWSEREYEALFASDAPTRIGLVAIEESSTPQLAGFVIARCTLDAWEIENVVVGEKHRRHGIGTKLIQELLRRASKGGAVSVLLEVRDSNVAARRLYETLGFSEQGRRRNYYQQPGEDAILLQRSLVNAKPSLDL